MAAETKTDLLSQPASWYAQQPEIERFQGFLRIPSISQAGPTDGSYHKAVAYLKSLLEPHLKCTVKEYVPNKPVLIATLEGTDPSLPSILLNSHYDVVPTMREMWSDDPFSAKILETGEVLARGTQDMKSVCMQYLEAILRLKARGVKLTRTVHLTYCPDEEIGGTDGMGHLIESPEWTALNVGAALDEGLANASEEKTFTVFYGERAVWWLQVRATGPTGHASRFIQNTAMEKLIRSINHFLEFRKEQEARLHAGCKHAIATKLGDVATLNLTVLQGGVSVDGGKTFATNVIPTEAMAGFDIRIPPTMPLDEFEAKVKEWTSEDGLSYKFVYKTPVHAVTSIDRANNPFWAAFEDAVTLKGKPQEKTEGVPIQTEIFPAGTDGRYVRQQNVPVFGFSPMARTPVLLHDHNERIHCGVYLQGIQVYERVIEALSNCRV